MPCRGEVYYDKNFKFSDGSIGQKLFIILTNQEPFLVVKTTSKPNYYNNVKPYCNTNKLVFYIPLHLNEGFPKDTYIQLNEIFEYSSVKIINKFFKNELQKKNNLSQQVCNSLMNCLKSLKDDISPPHYKLLFNKEHPRPQIQL